MSDVLLLPIKCQKWIIFPEQPQFIPLFLYFYAQVVVNWDEKCKNYDYIRDKIKSTNGKYKYAK